MNRAGIAFPQHITFRARWQELARKEVRSVAKSKVTSAKAAKAASQVLSSPSSSKAAKAAAGSALSQKPSKRGR